MSHANDNAFPGAGGTGLTKREHFAGLALQGLLAGSAGTFGTVAKQHGISATQVPVIAAIELADELIKQLNKEPT